MLRVYSSQSPSFIATHYEAPNNHQLLALMLHAIDKASGGRLIGSMEHHGPLRVPSILASVLSLLLLWRLGSRWLSPELGVLAAAFMGLSYWHLLYSPLLRGYSLAICLGLLCAWATDAALRGRQAAYLTLPILVAAFTYTLPSDLYYVAALGIWILIETRTDRAGLMRALVSLAVALLLSYLLFRPILAQMRTAAIFLPPLQSLSATPERLSNLLGTLGHGLAARIFVGAASILGAWKLWGGDARERRALAWAMCWLFVPVAASTLHGTSPMLRNLLVGLPAFCILAAVGLHWACRARTTVALCGLLAVSAGEVHAYLTWDGGLDVRRSMRAAAEHLRGHDSRAIVFVPELPDGGAGKLDLQIYAQSSHMRMGVNSHHKRHRPYQRFDKTIFIARDEAQARRAAAASGVDPALVNRLRVIETVGRLSLYEAAVDDIVEAAWMSVPPDASVERRADALTGLAQRAMRRRRYVEAARLLEAAKLLKPASHAVRFLLGHAYYLDFQDAKAAPELRWSIESDSENVHAPLYYADVLGELGERAEALRWYQWYSLKEGPPGRWHYSALARLGQRFIQEGSPKREQAPTTAAGWEKEAGRLEAKGSRERALEAWHRANGLASTPRRLSRLVELHSENDEYSAALVCMRQLEARFQTSSTRYALAVALHNAGAREEASRLRALIDRGQPGP